MQPLLTAEEVAGILRCSVHTVRRRVQEGRLRPVREGARAPLRFTDSEVRNYIAHLEGKH